MIGKLQSALEKYYAAKTELASLVEKTFMKTSLVQVKSGGKAYKVLGLVTFRPDHLRVKGSGDTVYEVHIGDLTPVERTEA